MPLSTVRQAAVFCLAGKIEGVHGMRHRLRT